MITVLAAAEQYELLAQAKTTAGLVFKESVDHEWLERIFAVYKDIIEESWVYQETIQKGLEKGLEVGLEKGLEKGKLEGKLAALHQVILDVIQERFPDIMPYARKQIEDFEDYEVLRRVNVKMITVQTPEEALQVLIALSKNDKNN